MVAKQLKVTFDRSNNIYNMYIFINLQNFKVILI
ncbi:Uncharacterised protein [Orientia tsutsugamushi]|uniref:Uncharacterized protein n=1 Tax=Orientia tsutsugamushi TaxID=784 RepID=A0A2U3QUL1_ORITS|nr:Uncharacterised protein [Orientia tsutsugamushi]